MRSVEIIKGLSRCSLWMPFPSFLVFFDPSFPCPVAPACAHFINIMVSMPKACKLFAIFPSSPPFSHLERSKKPFGVGFVLGTGGDREEAGGLSRNNGEVRCLTWGFEGRYQGG